MPTEKLRIFLSYAREDKAEVEGVYKKLIAIGWQPWMDTESLLPGHNWKRETTKALNNSDFVLVFFSNLSVPKTGYVQREFKQALDKLQEIPEENIFIIPIRLDDCQVPERFGDIHYCDLFEEGGFEKIVRAIKSSGKAHYKNVDGLVTIVEHELQKEKEAHKKKPETVESKGESDEKKRQQKNRVFIEQILAVRSQLSHYRKMVAEYRQKQQEQKKAAEQSGHYEWLKSAREVYQNNLGAEVAQPPLFFLVAAIILLLNAVVLSFLSMPVYAAAVIALGALVGFAYFRQSRKLVRHATENQEIENLKATFQEYFGRPLTSLPDILGQLEKLEQDYNTARVLAQQLKNDLAQLHADKRKIDEAFQNLTGERPEPGSWDDVLQQQFGRVGSSF